MEIFPVSTVYGFTYVYVLVISPWQQMSYALSHQFIQYKQNNKVFPIILTQIVTTCNALISILCRKMVQLWNYSPRNVAGSQHVEKSNILQPKGFWAIHR